ncbi:ciliary microtubule inner protein 4 isoform X2 [Rhinoderma darwinii]|uniref:ciliary microtubule inner protein 4 isoform X2 n=1 Tax=Rhinoderma darwinii TaxID=43563 RepID=UPI003F66FFEA
MEAKSSVIKCYSSLPTPRSAPSNTINLDNEKLQMSSTKLYNIDQRTMSNQRGRRSNTSQACMKNQQEDTRNLIPSNIRHKYGSSVVDQLICPVQVRSCLREEERRLCHQGYCIPKLSMKSCFMEDYPHKIYYELGHCLRSNLFPGAPIKQHSLVHDSYTAEVNVKGRLEKHNTHQWYGRKTDELAIWSEMVMKRNTIAKILQSQLKPSCAFPLPIRTNVPKNVPPPLLQPPKKPRKQRYKKMS